MTAINRRFEAISAMQKFIRRGNEIDALRAFFELADGDKKSATTAFNRVRITAHEDVGLGDPEALRTALLCLDDAQAMYPGRYSKK